MWQTNCAIPYPVNLLTRSAHIIHIGSNDLQERKSEEVLDVSDGDYRDVGDSVAPLKAQNMGADISTFVGYENGGATGETVYRKFRSSMSLS